MGNDTSNATTIMIEAVRLINAKHIAATIAIGATIGKIMASSAGTVDFTGLIIPEYALATSVTDTASAIMMAVKWSSFFILCGC